MPAFLKTWEPDQVKQWLEGRPESTAVIADQMGISIRTLYRYMLNGGPWMLYLAAKQYSLEHPAREVRLEYMTPEERTADLETRGPL